MVLRSEDLRPEFERAKPPIRRLIGAASVAFVVLGCLFISLAASKVSTARIVGFVIDSDAPELEVLSVMEDFPADEAGLRTGDVIVEVNGRPVTDARSYDQALEQRDTGEPVDFVVERDGTRVTLEVRPGIGFPRRADWLQIVTVLAYLVLALAALGYGGDDLRARLLFWFSAAVALELALPVRLIGFFTLVVSALVVRFLLNGIQLGLELHLVSLIPGRRRFLIKRPKLVHIYYIVGGIGGLAGVAIVVGQLSSPGSPLKLLGRGSYVAYELLYLAWAILVPVVLATGARSASTKTGRYQALLVMLGVIPWSVLTVLDTGWQVIVGTTPPWLEPVQPFVLVIYPIAVFAAIFRYHLFNIEVVVRRGLIYGTLTGILLLGFFAAIGAGGALVSRLVGDVPSVWVFSGATLLIGLLASPLHRWLQNAIDRSVFPERRQLRQRVADVATSLPSLGTLTAMGRHLVAELRSVFNCSSAAVLLAEPNSGVLAELTSTGAARDPGSESLLLAANDPAIRWLAKVRRPVSSTQLQRFESSLSQRVSLYNAAVAAPLVSGDDLTGLIFLGPKDDHEPYTSEEIELLSILASNAATVFENVRLFESATYEGLTGLLRRESILKRLDLELERAIRHSRPIAVAMADLDHFKDVNDTYGHLAGDVVLQRVAAELSQALRTSDSVGRYGGEEFLIVLPETDLEGARAVSEKVRDRIQRLEIAVESERFVTVTLSIGVAAVPEDAAEPMTSEELISRADANLLQAKSEGRNTVIAGSATSP